MFGFAYGYQKLSLWAEENFPPERLPSLTPQAGYKIYGYMGCPQSKIEEIQKLRRHLFFTQDPITPQHYALSRTRLFDGDRPVVLQIEILKSESIDPLELWKDPRLDNPTTLPFLSFVSFHPAIPSNVQERCKLKVRIHHEVTCSLQQNKGGICRAVKHFFNALLNKSYYIFQKRMQD